MMLCGNSVFNFHVILVLTAAISCKEIQKSPRKLTNQCRLVSGKPGVNIRNHYSHELIIYILILRNVCQSSPAVH